MNIDIIRACVTLLAFVIAFYTLIAREKKMPDIIKTVYSTVSFCLLIIASEIISQITSDIIPSFSQKMHLGVWLLFLILIFWLFFKVLAIFNRHINFRDDNFIKNTRIVRWWKKWRRSQKHTTSYEHTPLPIPEAIFNEIIEKKLISKENLDYARRKNEKDKDHKLSISLFLQGVSYSKADDTVVGLIKVFLKNRFYLQFTSAVRHPMELVIHLKSSWDDTADGMAWKEACQNIVLVDAFSSHFGFTDSTHVEQTKVLTEMGITVLESSSSFAGVHSSSAKAFNEIKKKQSNKSKVLRPPTLVIYEGLYGIVDLESVEQFRIFIRHLMPSEKLWGSMFTCIIETFMPKDETELLKSYADIVIDKTETGIDE